MKKLIVISLVMLSTSFAYSQVAINKDGSDPLPGSILHVKGNGVNALYIDYTDGFVGLNNIYPHYRLHLLESVTDTKEYGAVFEVTGGSTDTQKYAGVYSYINGTGGTNRAYEGLSYGANTNSYNIGVSGFAKNGKYNFGIQGMSNDANTNSTGLNYGGIFEGDNADYFNVGVFAIGHSGGSWNFGVYTKANEDNTTGDYNYAVYADASNSSPGTGVYWAGYFNGNTNVNGSIYQNGTVLHAKSVNPLINASAKIMTFKPVSVVNDNNETSYAFDAEAMKKSAPELVKEVTTPVDPEDKNSEAVTSSSVNITAMLPVLTKALQELNEKVEKLEAENNALKEEINKLKAN